MAPCPQCKTELPYDARKCPCCGKSFLASWSGTNELAIRRALKTIKSARTGHRSGRGRGLVDWRDAAGGLILGFFVLYFVFARIQIVTQAEAARSAEQAEDTAEQFRSQVRLTDSYLLPVLDGVEVRGSLHNGAERLLLQAEVVTEFRDPEGRLAGSASGVVKVVEAGKTVPFSAFGKLRSSTTKREGWKWKTELGKTVWAP
ncbi:MAG: hypothetical protein HY814_11905 [Candidatus Riflebacteria bacterium]|nr:hypothetical protein [Candidatus Riflebacteria bacterium]